MEGADRGLFWRYYPSICLNGLRKTTKNLSQYSQSPGRDLDTGLREYEAGVLTTRLRRSVTLISPCAKLHQQLKHCYDTMYRPKISLTLTEGSPVWWPRLKKSPTVTHACCKRRLKWVPSAWGYSWVTLSLGVINTETWSSRLGVGRWTNNPDP
jgi:hypothetical protein